MQCISSAIKTVSKLFLLHILLAKLVHAEYTEFCTAAPVSNLPLRAECKPLNEIQSLEYTVEVFPLDIDEGLVKHNISLIIIGSLRTSDSIFISSADTGVIKKQVLTTQDVGIPIKVRLLLANVAKGKWRCQNIVVTQSFRWWKFNCLEFIDNENREAIYHVTGYKKYTLMVTTGDEENAGTRGTIQINLKDSQKETGFTFIKEKFPKSSKKVATIYGTALKKIDEIELKNSEPDDPWYCQSINVQLEDGGFYQFSVSRWIGHPFNSEIRVALKSDDDSGDSYKDIQCHTRPIDFISGFTDTIKIVRVRCPMNCQNDPFAIVRGSSIHPSTSSVCLSAIYDGVMGFSGGELLISIVKALPNYYAGQDTENKEIGSADYEPSVDKPSFSFYTYLSYSIDQIKKSVRVVDTYGKLAGMGRLEIKRNGKWGTVCYKGEFEDFNQEAARKACQEFGYLHGVYLEAGCKNVKGTNVCAGSNYSVAVSGIRCAGNEKSIYDCVYEDPLLYCEDHALDVAVQCSNNPPTQEWMPGSIRLVDSNGNPTVTGIGRLEYYLNDWGTVCNNQFTAQSESVACKEMGYTSAKDGDFWNKPCKDVGGVNFCGKIKQKINAVNMSCDGYEKNLRQCPHETGDDIYCVHEEDVIIGCEGDGDSSGLGRTRKEDIPDVPIEPLGSILNLECSKKFINTPGMQKEAGSFVIAKCPSNCGEGEKSEVKGTFIYTQDSSICAAAIHAGVVDNGGGIFVLIAGFGQKQYFGSVQNGIKSEMSDGMRFSFLVSKLVPSLLARLPNREDPEKNNILTEESSPSNQGESSLQRIKIHDPLQSHINQIPIFSWCPEANWPGFRLKPQDFVRVSISSEQFLSQVTKEFTISALIKVMGEDRKWRTVIANNECNGFSLSLDKKGNIVFEQVCSPELVNTGYKPPANEKIHLLITFSALKKQIELWINKELKYVGNAQMDISLTPKMTIGKSSDLDTEYFHGDIDTVRIYDYILNPAQIEDEARNIYNKLTACPRDFLTNEEKIIRYTVDGRPCMTPCVSSLENDISQPILNFSPHTSVEVSCEDNLLSDKFNGEVDQVFRVICPPGCCSSKAQVFGTNIFAPNSSICRAALFDGVLRKEGGKVLLTLRNGLANYIGSMGHFGIKSFLDDIPKPRSFSLRPDIPVKKLSCKNKAEFILTKPLGHFEILHCPEGCFDSSDPVIGTDVYSLMSPICKTAIHAGAIGKNGGEIILEINGENVFHSSLKNGIQSIGAGSYLRSYKFFTSRTQDDIADCAFHSSSSLSKFHFSKNYTQRSQWEEIPLNDHPGDTNSGRFIFNVSNDKDKQAFSVHIKDSKCSLFPRLLIFKNFKCNSLYFNTTITLPGRGMDAGIVFNYLSPVNFMVLHAVINNEDCSGHWTAKMITDKVVVNLGPPYYYKFKCNGEYQISIKSNRQAIEAWVTENGTEEREQVLSHKDTHISAEKNFFVGFSACNVPETKLIYNEFSVSSMVNV